jgi:hypothetical protein
MKFKLMIVAILSVIGSACQHIESDDLEHTDMSHVFNDIAANAPGGGN